MGHEMAKPFNGFVEQNRARQEDDSEMIRFRPVEPGPLNDQDLFALEQVKGKLHVIGDIESGGIDLDKGVHRAAGLRAG